MKNVFWAVGGLIVIIIAVFAFTGNRNRQSDTVIPSPVSIVTPSPNLENMNLNSDNTGNMSLPFSVLTKEQITNKTAVLATDYGDIKIEFFDDSPIAVSNFVHLANKKFYDGLTFHRIINGFMIQGGDPNGNGTGGPGYKFPDEKVNRAYERGIVAMANAGPDTNGSQFFIMHQNYQLPPSYTIFGTVVDGIEAVDKIAETEVKGDVPVNKQLIKTVKIVERN